MRTSGFFFSFFVWGWIFFPTALSAQVVVAPVAFEMGPGKHNADVFVVNNSNDVQEIQLEARYGIPSNLNDGTIGIAFLENLTGQEPNASPWIRFFPRRVQLKPGEQQTIRMLVQPPADLPDGEYWSRIVVTQEPAVPVGDDGSQAVVARLNIRIESVLGFIYRKGTVETGISAKIESAEVRNDTLHVAIHADRTGNAAYLGQVDVSLKNAAGQDVITFRDLVTLYNPLTYTYKLPVSGLPAGSYILGASFNTDRTVPEVRIIPAPPVSLTTPVTW